MASHTPGPWHLSSNHQYIMAPYTGGGYSIARMDDLEAPIDQREGNALLIVLAPDLLAALQSAERHLGEMRNDAKWHPIAHCPVLDRVREVIARATGAQS